MLRTKTQVLREATHKYLENLDLSNPPPPDQIERELLHQIEEEFDMENANRDKGRKWKTPERLAPSQIADILVRLYPICRISCAGENVDEEYDLLAIYQTQGRDTGVYVTSEGTFATLAQQFDYMLNEKDFDEVMRRVRYQVPRKTRCTDPDLIAVDNGIFNYRTKTLVPFSPDYVFLTKSHVAYNPNAQNIVIHNDEDGMDWDVESWMNELSDDPDIIQLLWQILGAIIRPNTRWYKSAWLYSETGNNGKGTLCELMRQLCGSGAYASIPLADFGRDFMLEPLTRATAVIVDENDVGGYIDRAANLKAVITNDVVQINRKFKMPIAYQFFGFMVQCLNEFPRVKDKSDSFYRRQLFIPFTKCFTGHERRYIKSDYLHRQEVLEYVLHKVLHMDYDELVEPESCKAVLREYKEFNDPVRQFADEMLPQCKWDVLPFTFLFDLYKGWFRENAPSGSPQSRNTFIKDIIKVISSGSEWTCPGKSGIIWVGNKMSVPEPLILQYDLRKWMNPNYTGRDPDRICSPVLKVNYRGIQRCIPSSGAAMAAI